MSAIAPLVFVVVAIVGMVGVVAVILLAGKYSRTRGYRYQVAQCTASRDGVFTGGTEAYDEYNLQLVREQNRVAIKNARRTAKEVWAEEQAKYNREYDEVHAPGRHDNAVRDSRGQVAYDVTDTWGRKGRKVK